MLCANVSRTKRTRGSHRTAGAGSAGTRKANRPSNTQATLQTAMQQRDRGRLPVECTSRSRHSEPRIPIPADPT